MAMAKEFNICKKIKKFLYILRQKIGNEVSKKHVAGPAMIISKNYLTTSQTKMIKMFPTSRRTLWPNRICQRCFENGCFFHREQWQIKLYFLAFVIGAVLAESGAGPTQMSTVLVL